MTQSRKYTVESLSKKESEEINDLSKEQVDIEDSFTQPTLKKVETPGSKEDWIELASLCRSSWQSLGDLKPDASNIEINHVEKYKRLERICIQISASAK